MTEKNGGEPCPPHECVDMKDVRAGVDAIDRALVKLLAQRQRYMTSAARIKSARDQVHDQARIEDVVRKIKGSARSEGLSEAIAEPVWRLLVDRSIAFELGEWDRLHQDQAAERTAPLPGKGNLQDS